MHNNPAKKNPLTILPRKTSSTVTFYEWTYFVHRVLRCWNRYILVQRLLEDSKPHQSQTKDLMTSSSSSILSPKLLLYCYSWVFGTLQDIIQIPCGKPAAYYTAQNACFPSNNSHTPFSSLSQDETLQRASSSFWQCSSAWPPLSVQQMMQEPAEISSVRITRIRILFLQNPLLFLLT